MKTLLTLIILACGFAFSWAATTTINLKNKFSYGGNIGWMDWRGDAGSRPARF